MYKCRYDNIQIYEIDAKINYCLFTGTVDIGDNQIYIWTSYNLVIPLYI